RHVYETTYRAVRHTRGRPLRGRGEQRLLDGVLGGVEMAITPDDRTEHLRREVAQQALGAGVGPHISTPSGLRMGRTSIPHRRASCHRIAISMALSRISQSRMQ